MENFSYVGLVEFKYRHLDSSVIFRWVPFCVYSEYSMLTLTLAEIIILLLLNLRVNLNNREII